MNIGRCMNEALEVYKKNLGVLVLAAVLFDVLSLVSLSILMGPLIGGWCLMTVNALRREDKRIVLADMFIVFDKFFSLVGLFYLTFVPILLGFGLLLVPGMLLATVWFFCFFLVVDRGEGVFTSLAASRDMVMRSGFSNYFLLVVIVTAIALAPMAIPYAGFVFAWFVTPLAWLIEAAAYVQEVDDKKPSAKPNDAKAKPLGAAAALPG